MALLAQTSWMFGFCHLDDVITSQRKQMLGCALFDIFFKHLLTLKTNHNAGGFYDVKGTW